MIHPDSELRFVSPVIGYGLFATKLIPKGTITWVIDPLDQVLSADETEKCTAIVKQAVERYSYLNGKGERILCWDNARYVNHSCTATCLAPGFNFEIAVRDILPGDEITDDYGTLNLAEEMRCHCLSPQCRHVLRPDDFLRHGQRWDALVAAVFPRLHDVEQPLWELVLEKEQVAEVLSGAASLPSCLIHRFERQASAGSIYRGPGHNVNDARFFAEPKNLPTLDYLASPLDKEPSR